MILWYVCVYNVPLVIQCTIQDFTFQWPTFCVVVWVSIARAQHIDYLSRGGRRGIHTHTHTFFFILIWPLLHFPLPFSLSPSLSKFSQPFSIFFTLFWLSFPFSSSMELKHKGLALVKFTLKRIPPPHGHSHCAITPFLSHYCFSIWMKPVRRPTLYCRLHCSCKPFAFCQCNEKLVITQQTQAYWIVNVWFMLHC